MDNRKLLKADDLPEVFWVRISAKADSIPRRIRAKRWLKNGLHYNLECELIAPDVIEERKPK